MLIDAGADTTSSYLQSFFKVMTLHSEVMRSVQKNENWSWARLSSCWHRKELDLIIEKPRLSDWKDENSLPYVRVLIKEVYRWTPIEGLEIPHATTKTEIYEGRIVPDGTIIFSNLTAFSRDCGRYDKPDKFLPERFLNDNLDASASALQSDYKKRNHFHYEFDRRLCQKIFVAEISLFIVVSRTLWEFDIKPLESELPLDMDAKISKISFFSNIISIWLEDLQTTL